MRTINSNKRKQVFAAASKLVHDFRELGGALFAFFRPNKIKRASGVIDDKAVNPANLDHPVKNYGTPGPVSFSTMIAIWHEMEQWDLLKEASSPEK